MNHTSGAESVADPPLQIGFGDAQRLAQALTRSWDDVVDAPDGSGLPQISDYMIDRRLGEGGGGTVFHAVLPGWNDDFAIKWLHKPVADERVARRAWRELDLAERLDLPETPRVFEYGVHEGRIFIVSEMVEGRPLDEHCQVESLSTRARVELLVRICRSVHALHERGVIHRDIKPSNILIKPDGSPVVIDLGISALIDDDRASTLTATGAAIGTVAYMAPEQARGEIGTTSTQTDIYSLGATAFMILTGSTPHDVSGLSILEAIRRVGHERPRSADALAPKLPRTLVAALGRAIDPVADLRFRSVAEFGDELQCWLDGRPGNVQPRRWWRTLGYAVRRNPKRWGWSAAACLTVLGTGAYAGVAEMRHIDDRLELLAELEAREAWIDDQHAQIGNALRASILHAADGQFRESQNFLMILGEHARAGTYIGDDEQFAQLEDGRNALIRSTLRAIHAADPEPPTRAELAIGAVRALYQSDDMWDDKNAARIDQVIQEFEEKGDFGQR